MKLHHNTLTKALYRILFVMILAGNLVSRAEDRPNILFLITDDQFKSMMNFYPEGEGKNLTPNTDALAAEGTVMMRQYVTSPVCTPSRYGSLTGLYPSRSDSPKFHQATKQTGGQTVVQWNTFITDEADTLPRKLREAGYFTGMVGKNHAFETEEWEQPEWESDPTDPEVKALLERNRAAQAKQAEEIGFDFTASLYNNNPVENGVKALASHNLDWIAQGAIDFIDQAAADEEKPFFLYLATTIPHGPQAPEQSWNADRRITATGLLDEPLTVLPPASGYKKRLRQAKIRSYQKENILWLDDMVGAVVDQLKATGQYDNTIILYFNDHGQAAKGTLYEGGVHGESFLWKAGGFPAGNRCDVPVSNIDFAPTLLDLAGVEYADEAYDGTTFAPVLTGEINDREEPLFFELGYVRAVLHDGWKYIALRYPDNATKMPLEKRKRILEEFNEEQLRKGRPVYTEDPTAKFSHVMLVPGGGDAEHMSMEKYPAFYDADQLYHIAHDPNEQTNLAKDPTHAAKLAELRALLEGHLKTMSGTFGELKGEE